MHLRSVALKEEILYKHVRVTMVANIILGLMRMLRPRPPHWRCFSDNIGSLITRDRKTEREGDGVEEVRDLLT